MKDLQNTARILTPKGTVPPETLHDLAGNYLYYYTHQPCPEFHGLRDFYSFIRGVCCDWPQQWQAQQQHLVAAASRNFGGLARSGGAPAELQLLCKMVSTRWTSSVKDCIVANLGDLHARHLLLITQGSMDMALSLIRDEVTTCDGRPIITLVGSSFAEDQRDLHTFRTLHQIVLCMEQGGVLVLMDLTRLYGSLYDMLNQNYTVIGTQKNCRVALGMAVSLSVMERKGPAGHRSCEPRSRPLPRGGGPQRTQAQERHG